MIPALSSPPAPRGSAPEAVWSCLAHCSRYDAGQVLTPTDITALVAALTTSYPQVPATTVRLQLLAVLTTFVVGTPWRVRWDCQRPVLLATLDDLQADTPMAPRPAAPRALTRRGPR